MPNQTPGHVIEQLNATGMEVTVTVPSVLASLILGVAVRSLKNGPVWT